MRLFGFVWQSFFVVAIIFVLLVTAEAMPKIVPLSTLLHLFLQHSCLYSTVAVEKQSGRAQNGNFGRLFVYLWWDFDFCTDLCRISLFSMLTLPKESIKFVEKRINVELERRRWFVNSLVYTILVWEWLRIHPVSWICSFGGFCWRPTQSYSDCICEPVSELCLFLA